MSEPAKLPSSSVVKRVSPQMALQLSPACGFDPSTRIPTPASMPKQPRNTAKYANSFASRFIPSLTAQGKRRRSRPLDRRVRPEGQKGAPGLGEGRGPRKSAGPPERRSAATRIAARACCTSASGQKGLKALRTGRSAGMHGCAHKACDGTNGRGKPTAECGSA